MRHYCYKVKTGLVPTAENLQADSDGTAEDIAAAIGDLAAAEARIFSARAAPAVQNKIVRLCNGCDTISRAAI